MANNARPEIWEKCKNCHLEFNSVEEFLKHRDLVVDNLDKPMDLSPRKIPSGPQKAPLDLAMVKGNSYII